MGAHPRSRGENSWCSPRFHVRQRLIPAHAGKTKPSAPTSSAAWAHPRSRGENMVVMRAFPSCRGSSPLTRGKLSDRLRCFLDPGLIPAHAGKTPPCGPTQSVARAHPRSRGENCAPNLRMSIGVWLIPAHAGKTLCLDVLTHPPKGSSPLTRGKPVSRRSTTWARGLIPAHAGKTR